MENSEASEPGATILIVDDMPTGLRVLTHILADRGNTILNALTGEQALEIIRGRVVDLVMLDIGLPGINGFDVCLQLKANPATEKIPIIFISAHTATADIVRGFEVGGTDYITKPFQVPEVMSRVDAILRQRRTDIDLRQSQEALQNLAGELEARVAERNQELIVANEKLRELDAMKAEFISRIGHELRTPLTNIKLYASLLDRGKPERWGSYLQTFNQEIDVLQTMIETLLDVSYLDVSKISSHIVPTDVNMVLQDLSVVLGERFVAKSLIFALSLSPDLPLVCIDPILLHRVLNVLLTNTLTYTQRDGSVTVYSRIQEDARGSWVTVTVEDTGPGISEKDITQLFTWFYRGSAAKDYDLPGVGLGLAVARSIMDAQGGRITVQSQEGKGSAFTVWLKLCDPLAGI